jgi:catechol 2,3-dioxygenase-like lactoylglutathione lyase family enzyme
VHPVFQALRGIDSCKKKSSKEKNMSMAHAKSSEQESLKLEVVVIPVADVDRAKNFYTALGWRLDAGIRDGDGFRVVQVTPPGSPCSIQFGKAITSVASGSIQGLYLVVSDIEAARTALIERNVGVSELFHRVGGEGRVAGPDPQRSSYGTFATFSDPDGNGWLLQEVTQRLPGRVDAPETSQSGLLSEDEAA